MVEVGSAFLAGMPPSIQADLGDLTLDVRATRTRFGPLGSQMASLSTRMDRRDETVEHILRRLDLREAHPAPSA